MKLKAVEAICKAKKNITVTGGPGEWWIGDAHSFYPVYELPELNENIVFTIFDVPEDERGKWSYRWESVKGINLDDMDDTERLVQADMLTVHIDGRMLAAIQTREHISFLDTAYLKPFKRGSYELYERVSNTGQVYFAVKSGFELIGVIAPYSLVRKDIAEKLERMACLCYQRLEVEEGKTEKEESEK